jgi:nitroreductase
MPNAPQARNDEPAPGGAREPEADRALDLIQARQNVSPKRLVEPGPSASQLERILAAAAAAPDHGVLRPWRFVIVPAEKRALLGDAFAGALLERDPAAAPEQIEAARDKALRAPLLMLAVAQLQRCEPDIPAHERLVSLGAAIQNMLLCAQAMGFGSGVTSGQALRSERMRALFALSEGEQPVCFVNFGTVGKHKPPRPRPGPWEFTSVL